MAGILELPPELIADIVLYLEAQDIFAVRQCNKYLESSSLSHFGRRFFRKKGYLITSSSIRVLQSIASHRELRKYVQHVWFNPDCYTFITPRCAPKEFRYLDNQGHRRLGINLPSELDRKKYETYKECMRDHRYLLREPATLANELLAAFKSLPNLSVIGMRRSEDHHPWGWSRLRDDIGEDPRTIGPYRDGAQHVLSGPTLLFTAIIDSVAASDTSLIRLYTDSIEIDNISPQLLSQQRLEAACRELLYLEINLHRGWLSTTADVNLIKCNAEADYGEGLLRLLKACPNLLELGMQIFSDVMRSYMLPPIRINPSSWLRAYPHLTLKKQVQEVQLDHLRRIKLEKMTTNDEVLISLMRPSQASLTSIKLRDMRLISTASSTRPWQSVFEFFRRHCPNISYVLLYHLMYEGGGISFVEHPPIPVPYLDIHDPNNNPNPPHGEPAGGEFFTKYDHIALEASGRDEVETKLAQIVDGHWYQQPIFSYVMDEELWHTDTSDEEW